MTNSITDSLLKAMSIMVDNTVSDLSNDQTIKATITDYINVSTNKYYASYNGSQIVVFGQNGAIYSKGDTVYVLVPQGILSNTKYIIGLSSEITVTEDTPGTEDVKVLSDYNIIGKNAITSMDYVQDGESKHIVPATLSPNLANNWICCYDSESEDGYQIQLDEDAFIKNMNNADALLVKASFLTDLSSSANGDYGVALIINVTKEDGTESSVLYTLSTYSMTGDPMRYYNVLPQYLICDFSNVTFNYIEKIYLFSFGFTEEDTEDDLGSIDVMSLELYALSSVAKSDSGYVLSLTTPLGNFLNESTTKTTIVAKVFKESTDITSLTSYY